MVIHSTTKPRLYPYIALLEPSLSCNMKCLHCFVSAKAGLKGTLTLKEWFKVIDDLKKLKTEVFVFSGGEPFMYPHWKELINYIKPDNDKKITLEIVTNGSLITPDIIRLLKKKKIGLSFSLDGDQKTHDHIRQTKGAYRNVVSAIKLCKKLNFELVGIVVSINKINYNIREKLIKIILDLGVASCRVNSVKPAGRAKEQKNFVINKTQYMQLCEDLCFWNKKYAKKITISGDDSIGYCHPIFNKLYDGHSWLGCNAGKYVVSVNYKGDVSGCLCLQDERFKAGNVKEKNIADIWKDDDNFAYTRKYDYSLMKGNCKTCRSRKECGAGCTASAFSRHGTIYKNEYCYKSIKKSKTKSL